MTCTGSSRSSPKNCHSTRHFNHSPDNPSVIVPRMLPFRMFACTVYPELRGEPRSAYTACPCLSRPPRTSRGLGRGPVGEPRSAASHSRTGFRLSRPPRTSRGLGRGPVGEPRSAASHSRTGFRHLRSSVSPVLRGGPFSSRFSLISDPSQLTSFISFRINTCKSVSKQTTLTCFRMNTYEKHRGRGCYC